MPNTQKKSQKKKDREKDVRKKILRRREAIRRARKEEANKEASLEREYFERRSDPTLTQDQRNAMLEKLTGKAVKNLTPDELKDRDALIIARLKQNIEMLEEMEKQYLEEQAARERTNKLLETDGAMTMKEKMDRLVEIHKDKLKDVPEDLKLVGI